jgi:hypothetical protein
MAVLGFTEVLQESVERLLQESLGFGQLGDFLIAQPLRLPHLAQLARAHAYCAPEQVRCRAHLPFQPIHPDLSPALAVQNELNRLLDVHDLTLTRLLHQLHAVRPGNRPDEGVHLLFVL